MSPRQASTTSSRDATALGSTTASTTVSRSTSDLPSLPIPQACIYLCVCLGKPGLLNQTRKKSGEVMQMTRLEDLTPSPSMEHSSRPTLGFPLGTALLLLVIFALSGMFSCCYHWDKLRALLRSRHPDMFLEAEEHTAVSVASSSPPRKAVSGHKVN